MIGEMHEGENIDRFVDGLKYNVRVEVLKSNCSTFEECARVALNVDSALWRARKGNPVNYSNNYSSEATPMEIGNISRTNPPLTKAQKEQRKKDRDLGACFKCHKVGCRPYKCGRGPRINNLDVVKENTTPEDPLLSLSDSENE